MVESPEMSDPLSIPDDKRAGSGRVSLFDGPERSWLVWVVVVMFNGAAWLLYVMAGMAFLFGGRLIHAFAQTERILAEAEGIGLTVLFRGNGAILKAIGSLLEQGNRPVSLFDSLRE